MLQYRFKALDKAREPEELDAPVPLTRPRAWVAVSVVAVVVLAALAWAVFASLPRTVSGDGVLMRPTGTLPIQSTAAGVVHNVLVRSGDMVPAGAPMLTVLDPAGGPDRTVTAPFDSEVTDSAIGPGQVTAVGQTVFSVTRPSNAGRDALVAEVFVTPSDGSQVRPGMPVHIDAAAAPAREYGLLEGRIVSVGRTPASPAQIEALAGNSELAASFLHGDPPLVLRVALDPDPATASGYRWSGRGGPDYRLNPQTRLTATVDVDRQRPIDQLFGSDDE